MPVGSVFQSELREFTDALSGTRIHQLTNYRGHSHHLYFTNPGWYDNGRKLLISSDRMNRTNLFGIDLETGLLTQLTDYDPLPPPHEVEFLRCCVNPVRDEAYYFYGRDVVALDLITGAQRTIWSLAAGFVPSQINCTADGARVVLGIHEDLSARLRVDYLRGYVGFRETWAAKPLSRIIAIATDDSRSDTVWEERYWIGHTNASPTQSNLITFCHEGPWELVDCRIWGLDLEAGRVWKIRARRVEGEAVGHEHWLADGVHVAYHGSLPDGNKCMGVIRFDNQNCVEYAFPYETGHIHSNDFRLVVGDAGDVVRIWRLEDQGFGPPRVLCRHRCSSHIQQLHVHPRFNPAGTQVLFTSDMSGYGNVYLADVPDVDKLPDVEVLR
ncbi:MAG TPA: oligogalacturonate lyase family protein [Candidatus Latescibacteria bacterium]|nr:oligogalacturonate lyase family protein [Candidatus Latescibacterota bacterium]HOS64868.1 oligogalacturonate lyase family protein [Candidatus Latescibacterota bacterium]HPK73464.1 oligogalacturonate lyase family protein [Candidatus Latescibacterota bacterium]